MALGLGLGLGWQCAERMCDALSQGQHLTEGLCVGWGSVNAWAVQTVLLRAQGTFPGEGTRRGVVAAPRAPDAAVSGKSMRG
jgi:hypothetical protein